MKSRFHVSLMLFILALISGCSDGADSENAKSEYRQKLNDARDLMAVTAVLAVDVASKHSQAWRSATRSAYTTIDLAIYDSIEENQATIDQVRNGKRTVQLQLSQLNNPPAGFEIAHAKIVSVYGSFSSLADAAVSPSGSLMSYNQSVNRIQEEFLKGMNELKVLIP